MRAAVSAAYALTIDDVVLIKPTTLPRTSSGKVRRAQCRNDYLLGALDVARPPEPAFDSSLMLSEAVAK